MPRATIWALLFAAGCAWAQADVTTQAQDMLRAGRGAEAYELLDGNEPTNAGNVDFDLTFARAANAVGEYTRAIMALERVLSQQPDNQAARAEMGRALAGVGDRKAARTLLSESKEKGITTIGDQDVDQMLHAIERVEADSSSYSRAYIEFAAGYDSNINSAPGLSAVAVPASGGSVLPLDPAGTRQSGGFVGVTGGASGRMFIDPRWSLIGTVVGRFQKFGGSSAISDIGQIDATGGVSYHTDRDEYSLAVQAGTYEFAGDRARDTLGVVGEWTHNFDGFRQFNAYVQTGRLTYPQARIADVDREVVGATYGQQFGNISAYGGLYGGREKTRDASVPYLGHHLWGLRGGVQWPVAQDLTALVAASYESRDYGGIDPLFLVARRDRQTNLLAGLSWTIAPGWRVLPQWAWTRTTSSDTLAAYHRNAVSVAMRREF